VAVKTRADLAENFVLKNPEFWPQNRVFLIIFAYCLEKARVLSRPFELERFFWQDFLFFFLQWRRLYDYDMV